MTEGSKANEHFVSITKINTDEGRDTMKVIGKIKWPF